MNWAAHNLAFNLLERGQTARVGMYSPDTLSGLGYSSMGYTPRDASLIDEDSMFPLDTIVDLGKRLLAKAPPAPIQVPQAPGLGIGGYLAIGGTLIAVGLLGYMLVGNTTLKNGKQKA